MHAYLIIGGEESVSKEANKLASNLKAKVLEFEIKKIEDVRILSKFTSLTLNEKTAILVKNISEGTLPALNAFLKNLEEPQDNLVYILTSQNDSQVLPTIVSRCQIIKTNRSRNEKLSSETAQNFLKMNIPEKLAFFDTLYNREDALSFLKELVDTYHAALLSEKDKVKTGRALEATTKCYLAIKGNGNTTLQLTSLLTHLVD